MPAPRVLKGQRSTFLEAKAPEYAKAKANRTVKDVVAVIQQQFFARWPVDMALDVERSAEELEAVDDDAPLEERPDPESKKDELSEAEYVKAKASYKQYRKDLTTRKHPIESCLKDDYDKAHAMTMKDGDNNTKFCKVYDARKEKEKPKQSKVLPLYNKVLRDEFSKLPKEEQAMWEKRSEEDHKRELEEWKEKRDGAPSELPEDRQACIDRLPTFCKPISDGICARTGWVATLVLGGPEPRDGGRLNVIAIHGGTPTQGPVQMDWGASEATMWKEVFFLNCGKHLQKVYTVEECRSRALSSTDREGEQKNDKVEVMRWQVGNEQDSGKVPNTTAPSSAKDSGAAAVSSVAVARSSTVPAKSSDTQKASANQEGPRASRKESRRSKSDKKRKAATRASSDSETASSSDDNDKAEDNPTVTRSSPPRTRGIAREQSQKATTDAPPEPPRSPPRSVSPAATSPLPSPGGVPSPVTSPLPVYSGTSPSSHSYCSSSPENIKKETTPSPSPRHAPSPVPTTSGRSSSKRTAAKRSKHEEKTAEGSRLEGKRKEGVTDDVAKSSKRRRVEEEDKDGEDEEEGSQDHVNTSPDGANHAVTLPELPEGVGNGKDDFYASQALALFGHKAMMKTEGWAALVRKWLEFERRIGFDGEGKKLLTKHRPAWVAEWIGRGRNPAYLKPKHNVFKVLKGWWSWWEELQPQWRGFNDDDCPDLPKDYPEGGSWLALRVGGSNGITSVLAVLVYAAVQLEHLPAKANGREKRDQIEARADWKAAVEDVSFVLDCMLRSEA
ncbi:SERTA domain-containing protein 3 [Marasmius crinis-equi]|uniref:SERTA domain-containing protein 3 n=1 Tax=Marasmius crinis-equi TaxID=585013 RepID=A0ABR3EP25_9AGAR